MIPESIPGVLFNAVADKVHDIYPASRKKAERCALVVLETMIAYYEAVAKEEGL